MIKKLQLGIIPVAMFLIGDCSLSHAADQPNGRRITADDVEQCRFLTEIQRLHNEARRETIQTDNMQEQLDLTRKQGAQTLLIERFNCVFEAKMKLEKLVSDLKTEMITQRGKVETISVQLQNSYLDFEKEHLTVEELYRCSNRGVVGFFKDFFAGMKTTDVSDQRRQAIERLERQTKPMIEGYEKQLQGLTSLLNQFDQFITSTTNTRLVLC